MIDYRENTKRVRQELGTISLYDLEGTFPELIAKFQREYEYYADYMKKPHELRESNYGGGSYLDKTDKKKVIFDKIYVESVYLGEDRREIRVMGERAMTPEELVALEAKQKADTAKHAEQEKEQLRKLKEKYPDA